MKNKYEVKKKFIFAGTFTVEAESPEQAKEFAETCCGMTAGRQIHSSLPCAEVDWDFPNHPEVIIGRVRRIR